MSKKGIIGFVCFVFGVSVFAQDITTDHYRFADRFNMGEGRRGALRYGRVWDLYNTNKHPATDVQTFLDTLLQEQVSSGQYQNDKDINLEVFRLNLESDDDKRLTNFMDLNGQNVALMRMTDVPEVEYTMVYKLDGVWHILFFTRLLDMSKF